MERDVLEKSTVFFADETKYHPIQEELASGGNVSVAEGNQQ
jgi:hypothetical protein